NLREQLKCAFCRAKIRQAELRIRGDDSNQSDALEVMPLCNHLRADENIDFSGSKIGKHLLIGPFGADRVAVQAPDLGAGEFLAQFFFELLGSCPKKINVFGGALGAVFWHAPRKPAVMALQTVALLVIGQRDGAILALNSRAARAADNEPRVSAAIDQNQRLRAFIETRGDCFAELRGKR